MYSRVFIVVGALDECQVSDGCQMQFLSEIFSLQAKCGANVFATSRFIPKIVDRFNECVRLEIQADAKDIERYLEGHIGKFPAFVQNDPLLQNEIKTGISKAVGGL